MLMKYLNYVGLAFATSAICVCSFLLFGFGGILAVHAAQPMVSLQTQPPLTQAIPNKTPIRITLQAINPQGKPLSDVKFQLQLHTPRKTPWFTSDFPIVEGTTLLELNEEAPDGMLEFEQIMPIRGHYPLQVQVHPQITGAFEPFEQDLTLAVPENPVKYRNSAILLGILFLAGIGGGWIIGGDQTVSWGEVVPRKVRLLLSGAIMVAIAVLLFVNISAELSSLHGHNDHGHNDQGHGDQGHDVHGHDVHGHDVHGRAGNSPEINPTSVSPQASSQPFEIHLTGDREATVGQVTTQTVEILNAKTGKPEAQLRVKTTTVALADHQPIFAYQGNTDKNGQMTWKQQFFDGAPHQVIAEVTASDGAVLQASHNVNVDGIEPPLYIRLISLGYYTGLFFLSLWLGIGLHRRLAFYRQSKLRPDVFPERKRQIST